jgi:hypothetical protein
LCDCLETVLTPLRPQHPNLVTPPNGLARFCPIGKQNYVVRDMLSEIAFATHRPDKSASIHIDRLNVRRMLKNQPLGFESGCLLQDWLVLQQKRTINPEGNAPRDN